MNGQYPISLDSDASRGLRIGFSSDLEACKGQTSGNLTPECKKSAFWGRKWKDVDSPFSGSYFGYLIFDGNGLELNKHFDLIGDEWGDPWEWIQGKKEWIKLNSDITGDYWIGIYWYKREQQVGERKEAIDGKLKLVIGGKISGDNNNERITSNPSWIELVVDIKKEEIPLVKAGQGEWGQLIDKVKTYVGENKTMRDIVDTKQEVGVEDKIKGLGEEIKKGVEAIGKTNLASAVLERLKTHATKWTKGGDHGQGWRRQRWDLANLGETEKRLKRGRTIVRGPKEGHENTSGFACIFSGRDGSAKIFDLAWDKNKGWICKSGGISAPNAKAPGEIEIDWIYRASRQAPPGSKDGMCHWVFGTTSSWTNYSSWGGLEKELKSPTHEKDKGQVCVTTFDRWAWINEGKTQ